MQVALTVETINSARSDELLLKLLSLELQRLLPRQVSQDKAALVAEIRKLPRGLRAMAATHDLDVSMALDSLGWHFLNHPNAELCEETRRGLIELEVPELAALFEQALAIVAPHWDDLCRIASEPGDQWEQWLEESGLDAQLSPLDDELWRLLGQWTGETGGLLHCWVAYARKYPERVVSQKGDITDDL